MTEATPALQAAVDRAFQQGAKDVAAELAALRAIGVEAGVAQADLVNIVRRLQAEAAAAGSKLDAGDVKSPITRWMYAATEDALRQLGKHLDQLAKDWADAYDAKELRPVERASDVLNAELGRTGQTDTTDPGPSQQPSIPTPSDSEGTPGGAERSDQSDPSARAAGQQSATSPPSDSGGGASGGGESSSPSP